MVDASFLASSSFFFCSAAIRAVLRVEVTSIVVGSSVVSAVAIVVYYEVC